MSWNSLQHFGISIARPDGVSFTFDIHQAKGFKQNPSDFTQYLEDFHSCAGHSSICEMTREPYGLCFNAKFHRDTPRKYPKCCVLASLESRACSFIVATSSKCQT